MKKCSVTGSISFRIEDLDADAPSHHELVELERATRALAKAREGLAAAVAASPLPSPAPHLERQQETTVASPIVQKTIDEITKTKGVMASASALINNFKTILAQAVAGAIANGATAEELRPVSEVVDSLDVETDKLAAAVAANP